MCLLRIPVELFVYLTLYLYSVLLCAVGVGPASIMVGNLVAGKRIAQAAGRDLGMIEDQDLVRKVGEPHKLLSHGLLTSQIEQELEALPYPMDTYYNVHDGQDCRALDVAAEHRVSPK